jgi:hypothetical protein
MRGSLSRAAEIYNYVEVGLWPAIGVVVTIAALRRGGTPRKLGLIAALTLFAFGASDWAENATGGEWWHPWWLLLWKASCVLTLLTLGLLAARRKRGPSTTSPLAVEGRPGATGASGAGQA